MLYNISIKYINTFKTKKNKTKVKIMLYEKTVEKNIIRNLKLTLKHANITDNLKEFEEISFNKYSVKTVNNETYVIDNNDLKIQVFKNNQLIALI